MIKTPTNNYNYKNRGMWLENIINESNKYYEFIDKALIYKKPTPIKILKVSYPSRSSTVIDKAVFSSISTLDYNGVYKGRYIEFDAKECKNTTSFPLANIKEHQMQYIKNVLRHNGIVFLIIFINNEFLLLKGEDLMNFVNTNTRKSIPIDELRKISYKIKEKFNPRLDYLEIIDSLYFKEDKNGKN